MTLAAGRSRRARRIAVLAVAMLLPGACISHPRIGRAERTGAVVVFSWPEFVPEPGADGLTYELCVWSAQMGLPREEILRVAGLTETRYETHELPQQGAQVWSVRARFQRDGQIRASDWYVPDTRAVSAVVPLRGLARVP